MQTEKKQRVITADCGTKLEITEPFEEKTEDGTTWYFLSIKELKNPPRIESDTDDVCETSYRIYHKVDKQTQELADSIWWASLFRKLNTCYWNKDRRVVLLEWLQMKWYIKEIESDAMPVGDWIEEFTSCDNESMTSTEREYSLRQAHNKRTLEKIWDIKNEILINHLLDFMKEYDMDSDDNSVVVNKFSNKIVEVMKSILLPNLYDTDE